jgi:hypothetical protein
MALFGEAPGRRSGGRLRPSTQVLRQMTLRGRGKGLKARLTYDIKPDPGKNHPPLLACGMVYMAALMLQNGCAVSFETIESFIESPV